MTLRVNHIAAETEELSNEGKGKNKSNYAHKDGSFYIVDKKLLRTIFDEPEPNATPTTTPLATPEGTPVITRKKEEKEETQSTQVQPGCEAMNTKTNPKEELKIQDLQMSPPGRKRSNSSDRSPENSPGSPKNRHFFRTHRRSTSETNQIIVGSPLHKSPSTPEKRLHGSLPVGSKSPVLDRGKDLPPSTQTLEKVKQAKNYFEEYYWELLAYLHTRQKRDKKLKKTLQEGHFGKFQQETLVREHLKQETAILRSRRLCGRLSDFILVKKIGKGAYGEVFLCQKRNTREYLALKKLSKANMHVKNSMAHVQTEKDVLSEADSSWLVHLYYTFQDSEYIYFAMDYIPGGDLRNYIEHVESLPEPQARMYVAEMFLAVDALHTLGYIHRDLKPDNFLIDKDGHLKLADFGLSKKGVMESYGEPFQGQLPHVKLFPPQISNKKNSWKNRAKAYSLVGSPDYMAVEILRGEGYDWKADWWGLGCILFEMIVGFPPFTGDTPHEVFTNVLNYQMLLENPQFESGEPVIGEEAWDFISKVVCEPDERIGKESIQEIKDHKFFKGLEWEHVREMKPDFIPILKNETDTSYFGTAQPVTSSETQSTDHPTFLQKINNISNLTFDDMTFSKAIFERDRQSSGSSDEEGGSRQQSPRVDLTTGRKSPRGTSITRKDSANDMRRMPLATKGSPIKKVSSLDRLTHTWRVHSRSNRNAASKKEDAVIGEAPSLNYLSIHDWKVICTGAQRIILPRNAVVVKQGGYNTALYRVKSGAVRIEKSMIQGKQESTLVLGRLEKNKVFGEMSFVEDQWPGEDDIGGNVSASVIVDSETAELYRIERSFIFSLFLVDKDLFARFYQIIATMLADRIINLPIRDKLQQIRRKDSNLSSPVKVHSSSSDDKPQTPIQVTQLNPNRTTSPSSKKEAKSKRKRDEKFIKRFKLPSDSYVIQAYKCTLKKLRKDKTSKYHGRLYIGNDYLCFYSRIFGYIYKRAFSYKEITSLKKEMNEEGKVWLTFTVDDKKFFLYDFSNANDSEVFKVLEHIYEKCNGTLKSESRRGSLEPQSEDDGTKLRTRTNSQTSNTETEMFSEEEPEVKDIQDPSFLELSLSQDDWSLILEGSECVTFMKDQVILKQGENFDSIYQIGNGVCRVERITDDKVEVLGTLGTSEMFGEISFLGGVGASVDIVADQNNVDIYIITKNYIENLFKEHKGMEGKFYKFLALILSRRIRQRELEEQLRAATSKQVILSNID